MVDLSSIQVGDRVRVISDLNSVPHDFSIGKKSYQGIEFQVRSVEPYCFLGSFKSSQSYRATLEGEDEFYWFAEELEYVCQYTDTPIDDTDICRLLDGM